jgi:hypothetical protein
MTPTDRKEKTEGLLRTKGIPYFSGLPPVESEEETELKAPEEVGIRIACLFCVVGSAYCVSDAVYRKHLEKFLKKHQLWDHLTPNELAFLTHQTPDQLTINGYTWKCEDLFFLMWASNIFEQLPWPDQKTEPSRIIAAFPSLDISPWRFIVDLQLRAKSEILDASDLLYRLHWATTQARIEGNPPPGGLEPGVVYEWHYAVNWITNYDDEGWDNVSTDT